jgi:pimeloyl-ACP methyl ester carboxylesterase
MGLLDAWDYQAAYFAKRYRCIRFDHRGTGHDRTGDLHRIARPSLVIGTEDDPTVPGYFAADLHRAIGGSRLHMMKEGGHYSYRRRAGEFNAVVEAFLREVPPPS